MKDVKHSKWNVRIVWLIGFLISWITGGGQPILSFGFVLWLVLGVRLYQKTTKLFLYIILSSYVLIPIKYFVTACNSYNKGEAKIWNNATAPADYRIDRETRVPVPFQGCMRPMYYGLMTIGNDTGVKFCTSIFGYQANAYTGIYPDSDSVKSFISNYDTISVKRKNGKYRFESIENKLIAEFPLQTFNQYEYFDFGTHPDSILKGKVIDEKCLIFMPFDYENTCHRMPIYLVAIKEEKLLCIYQ